MTTSREQFEYEAGQALSLPTSIIELSRKGDGYEHAFDSMNIMKPLNGWWTWWKKSRAALVVELPDLFVSDAIAVYDRDKIEETMSAAGITVRGDSDG